ncbi:MAG: YraN family protein [Candidatus Omnitrophota bacterium]
MSKYNLDFGKAGENRAEVFLKQNGYKILVRNYRTKLGEIDLIAKDKNTVCFIEVKTRLDNKFGLPVEAITNTKQRQIIKTATVYLKENNLLEKRARFDVVSVIGAGEGQKTEVIKNAFSLDGV